VMQLLYMTEFVVLAEMIEIVVPVIYGESHCRLHSLRCRLEACSFANHGLVDAIC
jgi:hypothetical protein